MIMEMVVASVVAGSSVCSDHFDNVSRFNPTELSDYQKCVHQVHGNTSGRVGNNIWVETDGVYTYIPVQDVAGRSKDRIQKIITSEVIVNVIDNGLKARVAELEEQAQTHMQERAQLIASLASEGGILEGQEIASVADLVNKLNLAITAAEAQGVALERSIERVADLRLRAGGIIDFVYGTGHYRNIDAVLKAARDAATAGYTLDTSGNTHVDGDVTRANGAAAYYPEEYNFASGHFYEITYTFVDSRGREETYNLFRYIDRDGNNVDGGRNEAEARTILRNAGFSEDEIVDGGAITIDTPSSSQQELRDAIDAHFVREIETEAKITIGSTDYFAIDAALADAINIAVDEAWSAGYDAGYDAGYNAGYDAGFADGVASVQ